MKMRMSQISLLSAVLAATVLSLGTVLADSPIKPLPAVQKAVPAAPANKTLSPSVRALPAGGVQGQNPAGPSASGSIQSVSLAQCATGFNKTAENKGPNGELHNFECTT